jgi:molybdopterin synthase sulfur carrier subunit
VKLLYFAWVKEKTGIGSEVVDPPADVKTVSDLIVWLRERSPKHADAFADLSMIRFAVNQDFAHDDFPVKSTDEVAFFPPMTGG